MQRFLFLLDRENHSFRSVLASLAPHLVLSPQLSLLRTQHFLAGILETS